MSAGSAGGAPRGRTRAARRAPMVPGKGPLARAPAVAVFALVATVFAAGVIVGGPVGAALLVLLALGVAALLAGTWARLTPPDRIGRLLVLGVLLAVAVGVAFAPGAGR